jgi:hypothetical protein
LRIAPRTESGEIPRRQWSNPAHRRRSNSGARRLRIGLRVAETSDVQVGESRIRKRFLGLCGLQRRGSVEERCPGKRIIASWIVRHVLIGLIGGEQSRHVGLRCDPRLRRVLHRVAQHVATREPGERLRQGSGDALVVAEFRVERRPGELRALLAL